MVMIKKNHANPNGALTDKAFGNFSAKDADCKGFMAEIESLKVRLAGEGVMDSQAGFGNYASLGDKEKELSAFKRAVSEASFTLSTMVSDPNAGKRILRNISGQKTSG